MNPDDQRYFKRIANLLRHLKVMLRVARQQKDADAVRAADLAAMDRNILDAGARIARDQQTGCYIGAAIEFVVLGDRQQLEKIDLAMHDILGGTALHFDPGQWMARRFLKSAEQLI